MEIYGLIPNKQPGIGKKKGQHKRAAGSQGDKQDSMSSPARIKEKSELLSQKSSPNAPSPNKMGEEYLVGGKNLAMTFNQTSK